MRTLQSELIEKGLTNKRNNKQRKKPTGSTKEKFSRRELEELMGKYQPTFRRVRGSFRSK